MSELTFMEILIKTPIIILWLLSMTFLKLFIAWFFLVLLPVYLARQTKKNNSLTKPED